MKSIDPPKFIFVLRIENWEQERQEEKESGGPSEAVRSLCGE